MKIISHRGNISGPIPAQENSPSFIDRALSLGLDVEIDLRRVNNNFFLGHDNPDFEVSMDWLDQRKKNLWIHTKNISAFEKLLEINNNFIFFYYTSEPIVLVSNGKIWSHQLEKISNPENCIAPLITKSSLLENKETNWHGVCTDYPLIIKKTSS
tara:strand:+ start:175 stop:639 length:465 start_codon:yes stop_codon:yes gene_type:complete